MLGIMPKGVHGQSALLGENAFYPKICSSYNIMGGKLANFDVFVVL